MTSSNSNLLKSNGLKGKSNGLNNAEIFLSSHLKSNGLKGKSPHCFLKCSASKSQKIKIVYSLVSNIHRAWCFLVGDAVLQEKGEEYHHVMKNGKLPDRHREKQTTDRLTDKQTNGRTDRQTVS